jgi:hypothetical protein
MKAPMRRGVAVNQQRLNNWTSSFRFYRAPPAEAEIRAWLARFKQSDKDLGARILDCVEVISEATIQQGYKSALESMDGWHRNESDREGRWVFTGFGGPGESGMAMLRIFREANNLTTTRYDKLFRTILEIPSLKLSSGDTVVLVDDFSGTGWQICNRWPTLNELIACDAKCYLVLTAATVNAIQKIQDETTLDVLIHTRIQKNENIFSTACGRFSAEDKSALLHYCARADRTIPKGFGECGLLYVLSHKTPNNSIPILHANHPRWVGLFPRSLQPGE